MDDLAAMKISSMGLAAQRTRMRVIAENLANQHTTGPNGPYQRKDTILESIPLATFQDELNAVLGSGTGEVEALNVVQVKEIAGDGSEPLKRYLPNHPQADADGYVAFPNISIIREMTDMIEANRSYEANLAVSKTTREMLTRAMDLLG